MSGIGLLTTHFFHLICQRYHHLRPRFGRYRVRQRLARLPNGYIPGSEMVISFRRNGEKSDPHQVSVRVRRGYRLFSPRRLAHCHGPLRGLILSRLHLQSLNPRLVRLRVKPRVPPLAPARRRRRGWIVFQGRRWYPEDGLPSSSR